MAPPARTSRPANSTSSEIPERPGPSSSLKKLVRAEKRLVVLPLRRNQHRALHGVVRAFAEMARRDAQPACRHHHIVVEKSDHLAARFADRPVLRPALPRQRLDDVAELIAARAAKFFHQRRDGG